VLDRRLVPPDNILRTEPERRREALALLGAWRVAGARDRLDNSGVQTGRGDKVGQDNASFRHPFRESSNLKHVRTSWGAAATERS
jgi:hypothetical protein